MYDIDIYYKKFEHNNMNYSIDMLRLKTYITFSEYSEIEFLINSAYKEHIKRFWVSDRIMCFHYNFLLKFDNHTFWFGFQHNNEKIIFDKHDSKFNLTIEFNPNKLRDNSLISHILDKFSDWHIKSYDLAIDIPINILDIVIDINTKRKLQTYTLGKDNLTYRYGSGHGKVKIYNKKIESDLNIVGYLTRVEVSIELDDFPVRNIKNYKFDDLVFPYLYLNQYIFSFSDLTTGDKTTLALLYAVQHGYPIKELTRSYKEKVKKLLEGGSRINFDKITATTALQQIIYTYFVRRESKQVIF